MTMTAGAVRHQHGAWSRAPWLLVGASAVFATGCGSSRQRVEPELIVVQVPIDEGVFLDVEPGVGVGVFVEYETGGRWEVFTSCDTELSGFACDFDIIVSVEPGERIEDAQGVDLEVEDWIGRLDDGAVQFLALTSFRFDRWRFRTSPGVPLRVDALVDGFVDLRTVFWNGGGALQTVAPSMPLDFKPDQL